MRSHERVANLSVCIGLTIRTPSVRPGDIGIIRVAGHLKRGLAGGGANGVMPLASDSNSFGRQSISDTTGLFVFRGSWQAQASTTPVRQLQDERFDALSKA